MSKRSRRRGKSKRNTWIALGVLIIIVVSAGGFYAYNATSSKPTSSTNSTSSSGAGPYAILDTSEGTIVLQLFPQIAPETVANFESLANSSFYNDLVWHRIVPASGTPPFGIIQTGDPNTRGAVNSTRSTWGEGEGPNSVPLEVNSAYHNDAGYVGLAHTSASTSGGSQFYINLTNNSESLDGQYTVFAKVVQGISVVDAIAALPIYTNSSSPYYDQPINANDALLISVTIQSTP